jgi:putative addiction module killer protein
VIELRKTERFARWLDQLRDVRGRARIQARIERPAAGNPGDVAPQPADIRAALRLARGLTE